MLKKQSNSRRHSGFTLVELVTTIILLGILAAVALPRFINVSSEAQIAVLETMGSAILSAATLVYAKALIQGKEDQLSANVDLDGDGVDDVAVQYGYPSGSRSNGVSKIMGSGFENGWTWSTNNARTQFWLTTAALGGRTGEYINQTAVRASDCYLIYYPAASAGALPTIEYFTTDC